jgi:hypothetical protein
MMKDLHNMKKLGGELGQATATATMSNDSKAMPTSIHGLQNESKP